MTGDQKRLIALRERYDGLLSLPDALDPESETARQLAAVQAQMHEIEEREEMAARAVREAGLRIPLNAGAIMEERLAELLARGEVPKPVTPEYEELSRRLADAKDRMLRFERSEMKRVRAEQEAERRSSEMRLVVNIRFTNEFDVYVGRGGAFGNPIRPWMPCTWCSDRHGEDAAKLLECYEAWLRMRLAIDSEFRDQVRDLSGKVLGCYCAPRPCHGDVLARVSAELAQSASH